MTLREKLGYYSRMVSGLGALLRTAPPAGPDSLILDQMANRAERFLELARRVIFADPSNPFYAMLRLAGCGYEDLAGAVRGDGLESTLAALHRQGVYLDHDEYKGKKPIVRSNRVIPSSPASFRNPLVRRGMETVSSGSRGGGTSTSRSAAQRLYREAQELLIRREFPTAGRAQIQLRSILPAGDGIGNALRCSRLGFPVEKWFAMQGGLNNAQYRTATHAMVRLARLHGEHIPLPSYLPPNDFSPVAAYIAKRKKEGASCLLTANVSPGVRVAAAAAEQGLDIEGTLFLVAGETLTDGKRRTIENTGAEVFPRYATSEFGAVGHACRAMTRGNSVHLFHDHVAVIGHRREAPLAAAEVDALLFTTLLPLGGVAVINLEMGDAGTLEPADCDCAFSRAGFTTRIRDLYSYGKLTGQGVTLVGTDVLRVLEEVLPARFGGAPGDYQLTEEDGGPQTRIVLRVGRRVPVASLAAVRDCFLGELRQFQGGVGATRLWRFTGAVEARHEDPVATRSGKILPLHLLGPGSAPPGET